jgi:5-methylthioadenosine/S-adenosylhomocysteine deaminase
VELLDRLGIFDLPALAAHCLYLSKSDITTLAARGVTVAHCAKTYLKLAMGVAPVLDMLRQGVRVAVGTDGAASSNSLDMLESLRLGVLVQKLWNKDPEALPSVQALRLATEAGASAMGFADSGVLAPGRRADLILVDMRKPHLVPRHDLAANLVHAAQSADVRHVFVDGRMIMRSGHLLTLDEERIRHEAERRGLRLVSGHLNSVRRYQA